MALHYRLKLMTTEAVQHPDTPARRAADQMETTMTKTLSLLAAATMLIANAVTAPVAEAGGGGVRLQFGYPLGSFVARPSGNHAAPSYSHRAPSYAYAEQKRAARAAAIAEARRDAAAQAKREAVAEARRDAAAQAKRDAIAEAKRDAAADARRDKIAAERAESRRQARLEDAREEKVAAKPVELETASVAPDAAPVPGRPEEVAQADVSIGEPKVVLKDAAAKDIGDNSVLSAAPVKAAAAPARALDCKKFIPSAGLTISVPCAN